MSASVIPLQLVNTPHWLVWRDEKRNGKHTKVPYDAKTAPRDTLAKVNAPETWADFATAERAADPLLDSKYSGLGFVLSQTNLVGIDFDGVLDNGVAEPYVLEIIKLLGHPYCEITPSCTGLRVFVECDALPEGGRKFAAKKDGVEKYGAEIYSGREGGRYLTVTGEKFGDGEGIPHIEDLSLVHLLISRFADEKFKRQWIGDASDYAGDDSRLDMALMGTLARHFKGDASKMEQVFGLSVPGHREKWINRADYRQRTIKAVLSDVEVVPEKKGSFDTHSGNSPTSEILSVLASDVVPVPIEFLWEPYLQRDALNAFYGNPSVGKGNTAMDIVARLTSGRSFPTESSTERKPMRCVILAAEEGVENTLVPRLIAAGADLKLARIIKSVRVHGKDDEINERLITFQTDMAAVKKDLQAHPEEHFLLIDPITNYVGDINFNQDGEVRPVLTMLVQLAEELKITVLIVGHFNKNTNVGSALDKPGGGRAWTAVPRACWGFFRQQENKNQRVMVNLKLNNAKESDTGLIFTIETRVIGTKPDGKPWGVSGVEWGEKTDASADDMVSAEHPETQQNNKGVKFLNDLLQKRAQRATKVYEEAEAEGIHERTIKRACVVIGVLKFKLPGEGWTWQHPTDPTPIPDAASNLNREAQRRREQEAHEPSTEVEVL